MQPLKRAANAVATQVAKPVRGISSVAKGAVDLAVKPLNSTKKPFKFFASLFIGLPVALAASAAALVVQFTTTSAAMLWKHTFGEDVPWLRDISKKCEDFYLNDVWTKFGFSAAQDTAKTAYKGIDKALNHVPKEDKVKVAEEEEETPLQGQGGRVGNAPHNPRGASLDNDEQQHTL